MLRKLWQNAPTWVSAQSAMVNLHTTLIFDTKSIKYQNISVHSRAIHHWQKLFSSLVTFCNSLISCMLYGHNAWSKNLSELTNFLFRPNTKYWSFHFLLKILIWHKNYTNISFMAKNTLPRNRGLRILLVIQIVMVQPCPRPYWNW